MTLATLTQVAEQAREHLDETVWNYLEGGAGQERTVQANRAAFDRWWLSPRILAGNQPPDLSTTFLGRELRMPVLTSPFGADGLLHGDGQRAVFRAARAAGIGAMAPHVSTFALEDLAAEGGEAAQFVQLHPVGEVENFLRIANRAAAAGYHALCITADCPTAGYRDRVRRAGFSYRDYMQGNYDAASVDARDHMFGQFTRIDEPVWTWAKLRDVTDQAEMPFVVKGVMCAEDARAAVDAGASGVFVSNHGGRQLDCLPGTLDVLPECVAEVGSQVEVAIDGGIRRGTDIVKALALGARVVVIGRAAAFGLAADGAAGVGAVLDMLFEEMRTTMALLGRSTVASLTREVVRPARATGA